MKLIQNTLKITLFFSLILVFSSCEKQDPLIDDIAIDQDLKAAALVLDQSTIDQINYLYSLIEEIEALLEDGTLNKGQANALIVKIENSIKSLENGNDNAAENQLGAFINEAEDYVENGVIPEEIGEEMINDAEIAVNQLNGLTYVPDDNFEQALIDLGIDQSPLDDYVPTTNIETISVLDLKSRNISDLTGIRSFTSLRILNCWDNQISAIDVSNNTELVDLTCVDNQLSNLDVSNNAELIHLYCDNNQLSSLDVSNNIALTRLHFTSNQISEIDVSNNTELIELNFYGNQISVFDISNNTKLTFLNCGANPISTIDVSNNTELTTLFCFVNQLSNIDVSNNTKLTQFVCSWNQLTSLDISNNPALIRLNCQNNPSLYCIQVQSISELPENYQIDPHTSFSEDCGGQSVNTFTDPRDGRTYLTVQIGDQVWMAENLAYLPTVNFASDGSNTDPRFYVYSYDGTNVSEAKATSYYQDYGVLYNWPAAMESCPDGWHLPSDAEWIELEMNLGMSLSDAYVFGSRGDGIGDKLKATEGWDLDGNGTNESGFAALPGGYRNYGGECFTAGGAAFWWTSTERSSNNSWDRSVSATYSTVRRLTMGKEIGYSVRCIKD